MDWQELTIAVTHAQTLEPEALEVYLQNLSEDSPEISDDVRQIIQNARQADGFFMTAVGDYLPDEQPLYSQGDIIGLWKIDELSGSGGMGDVYKAHRVDNLYDHIVALKVMRGDDQGRKARFDRERKRLAMLKHTGIASIIDGGVSDQGHPYLVMDFVDGEPIFDFAQIREMGEGKKLGLFRQVCRAVSHAHNNLILHRDLKSENILVTADGALKLIDFGIATLLDDELEAERGPFSLATAAPEQLKGEPLSVQTDIFALGAVLHQVLTGKLPVRRPDGDVKTKAGSLPLDLQAILEKSLHIDPAQRYETVAALNADIAAYQTSLPVMARNGSQLYRIGKLLKRAPIASALAASFVAALAGGLFVSQHYARAAQSEAARANEELTRANWNADNADILGSVANSYVDAFQYVFGQDEEIEQLSDRLIDYHALSMKEDRHDNPTAFATKSYAVGKHFLQRNDYVNARKVLEPWINEGLGDSPKLLNYGKSSLGHTYRNLGEPVLALEMFESVEAFYIGTPQENTIEHAAVAITAALLSGDASKSKKASKIIDHILQTDNDLGVQMYLNVQIFQMESKLGNWEASYKALSKAVAIIESGVLGLSTGLDTVRLNLAEMDVLYQQDFPSARKRIAAAQEFADSRKGESKSQAKIYALQALMTWSEGDVNEAQALITQSIPLTKKYSGMSSSYVTYLAYQGMIYADMAQFERAKHILNQINDIPEDNRNSWPDLLQLYLTARQAGVKEAQNLYDSASINQEAMHKSFKQVYILKMLEKDGLKL